MMWFYRCIYVAPKSFKQALLISKFLRSLSQSFDGCERYSATTLHPYPALKENRKDSVTALSLAHCSMEPSRSHYLCIWLSPFSQPHTPRAMHSSPVETDDSDFLVRERLSTSPSQIGPELACRPHISTGTCPTQSTSDLLFTKPGRDVFSG